MDQPRAPAEVVTRTERIWMVLPTPTHTLADELVALAILIDSQIGRILGNFFMNVSKPPFALRLFTSEAEAIAWLKAQVT